MKPLMTCFGLLIALAASAADTVWLDSLDLSKMRQGYGQAQTKRSIRGTPLAIKGKQFERGVGTHAASALWIQLDGGTERFSASVGVDDAAHGPGSVVFRVLADGKKCFDSGIMKTNQAAKTVELDLRGVKTLLLQVTDAGDGMEYDHADWAEAKFVVSGPKPHTIYIPSEQAVILTPKPGPAPRINGPKVYGCRPGSPFLYRIPAQG
ncbi:MAG TPA: NPCBM/NEW2 domain-containing protein, partial [Candidatus Sulfotelmatobacter sp.]|nr:NPCBM/NEW2 domain-containing protein [Candidatus Sulfotelmatobacter sp.]